MDTKTLFRAVCAAAAQNLAAQAAKKVVGSLAINALGRAGAAAVIPAAIPVAIGVGAAFMVDQAISLITED